MAKANITRAAFCPAKYHITPTEIMAGAATKKRSPYYIPKNEISKTVTII